MLYGYSSMMGGTSEEISAPKLCSRKVMEPHRMESGVMGML